MIVDQKQIDELRAQSIPPQSLYINGQPAVSQSTGVLDVISPIDGSKLTTLVDASADDVDTAVNVARQTFDSGVWSRAAPAQRKKVMHAIADVIEKHALELAVLGVRDNGTEFVMALKAEPGSAAGTFRYYAEAIDKVYGEVAPTAPDVLGLVHRDPIGVVGAIVPWNFPLMIGSWKLAPALAAGNSIVIKPAEGASLSLLRLAQLCSDAGLPDGVLNVVTGRGSVAGKAMGLHMDIDVIAFTGSGGVGRQLLHYAADSNLKRIYLELGGKSPNIVFADAPDLDQVAKVSAAGIFRNSGQVCIAGSRLLVEQSIHDEFVEKLKVAAESYQVGDPLALTSQVGAIASEEQLHKNLSFVDAAEQEGATLVCGGRQIESAQGGFYMQPTIFDNVALDMALAREEVFGPVLAVIPFVDEAEAIAIANSTDYGLAAAVWTSNLSTAHRMVKGINAGLVHVNTYGGSDLTVPLGGHKQSGNGADKSLHALDKFCDLKSAWIQL